MKNYLLYVLLLILVIIGISCNKKDNPEPGNCTDDWVFFSVPYVNEINAARTQLGSAYLEEDVATACTQMKNALSSYILFLDDLQQCEEVPLPAKVLSEIDKTEAELDALGDDCK